MELAVVHDSCHPRILINTRGLSPNNPDFFVRKATICTSEIYHINLNISNKQHMHIPQSQFFRLEFSVYSTSSSVSESPKAFDTPELMRKIVSNRNLLVRLLWPVWIVLIASDSLKPLEYSKLKTLE